MGGSDRDLIRSEILDQRGFEGGRTPGPRTSGPQEDVRSRWLSADE